jgi:hypothetical protein
LSDWEVLELAATEGRILVSHDRRTMPEVFGQFLQNSSSPGLFLISQKTDLLITVESTVLAWIASEYEE